MKLLLLILTTLLFTSCKYRSQLNTLNGLEGKKDKVEQISMGDLTEESQMVLRDYFRSVDLPTKSGQFS